MCGVWQVSLGEQFMADASPDPSTARRPGTPRWVIAIGVVLVAVILLAVVVLVVGGGQHGPGMHTGSGGDGPSASASTGATAGGAGAPADATEANRRIAISAVDARFDPADLTVAPGDVVTFVVTNAGQAAHEFTLGDAAMQAEHATAMEHMPEGMRHDQPNSISIEPGATKELTWRFGSAGILEYACHEPGQYEGGMHGRITVG